MKPNMCKHCGQRFYSFWSAIAGKVMMDYCSIGCEGRSEFARKKEPWKTSKPIKIERLSESGFDNYLVEYIKAKRELAAAKSGDDSPISDEPLD